MKGFLDEGSGRSIMRAGFLACIITACLVSIIAVVSWATSDNKDITGIALLVGSLLGTAFVGKGVQKFAERNNGGGNEKDIH